MDVKLPSGQVITGIPEGTSKEDIKKKAIEAGLATEKDFVEQAGDRGALDFLDVGTGLGGALAGAAAGTAILPGVGTVVGGILGGAAGTFGGEVAEDVIAGGNVDLDRATESAATGAVFDVATLGLGKVIRPLAKSLGIMPADILNKVMPTKSQAFDVGSKESLQQTEQLLASQGGGLSAVQAGATGVRKVAEQIGDEGILSGARSAKRVQRNAEILKDEMQRQIDGVDPSFAQSIDDVGKHVFDVINAGRNATMDIFDKGLGEIAKDHGGKSIINKPMRDAIEAFEQKFATDFGTKLSKETLAEIKDIKTMFQSPKMSVQSLIDAQQIINRLIREAGDISGNKFNSTVEFQLSQLNKDIGNAIEKTLKTRGRGGAAGQGEVGIKYAALNKMYGDAMNGLLPKLNESVIKGAKAGDYDRIGKLLVKPSSASKVSEMMSSIDKAFAQMQKAGTTPPGVKTAKDAKRVIRQSYLAEFFKDVADESDIYNLANKAKLFSGPAKSEVKKIKTIMGEDFPQFKALVNAISESKPGANTGIFGLALRSREAGIVTTGGLAAGAGALSGIAGAAAVFAIPEVLGRVATNRKAVARLLDLDKQIKKNPNIKPELVASAIAKVFDELSETDRESLAYALQQPAPQNTPQPSSAPAMTQEEMLRQEAGL